MANLGLNELLHEDRVHPKLLLVDLIVELEYPVAEGLLPVCYHQRELLIVALAASCRHQHSILSVSLSSSVCHLQRQVLL